MSEYVKAVALLSLQRMSNMLCHPDYWGCSVTFDEAAFLSNSCIYIPVRFYANGKIRNYHVLAIPMHEQHTGQIMIYIISKLLSSLCGDTWNHKLPGISNDGSKNMGGGDFLVRWQDFCSSGPQCFIEYGVELTNLTW